MPASSAYKLLGGASAWRRQEQERFDATRISLTPAGPQNKPSICPCSLRRMLLAEGTLGKPGMVMISPVITTINSAPAASLTSRIGTTWPVGAPRKLGSVENEYCVLAM